MGIIPFPPTGMMDLVVSGAWEITDGEPSWVWTYKGGWKQTVSALQVAMDSTKVKGFKKDFAIAHAEHKVELIYQMLDLPQPSMPETRRKLVQWYEDGNVPQLHFWVRCKHGIQKEMYGNACQ